MENIKITFNPKQKHLDEIAEWMIEEKKIPISNNGNWSSISSAFNNKNLVVATYKGVAVGFYALYKCDLIIDISVAEINPNYRKKGIGKLILEAIIEKYEKSNIYAFKLICSPESSRKIWKKLGFNDFPENSQNDRFDRPNMFKIIKPYLKPKKKNIKCKDEIIEVWNDKAHKTNDDYPTWIWNIEYYKNTNILKKPIIHFGHYDWRIRWKKDNITLKDCSYKYFNNKNDEFRCIIIKELPTNIKCINKN